jgi:hypothetical protein
MLLSLDFNLVADVSGQPIRPIFKLRHKGCPETMITNYESTPRNIPEERISHLHRGRSLRSRTNMTLYNPLPQEPTPQNKINENLFFKI